MIHRDPETYPESGVPPSVILRDHFGPYTVPPGTLFAMGDNRDDSRDSRFWGPVPEGYVKGRAILIYWSFDAAGAEAAPGLVGTLRRLSQTALHFFSGTRWPRTLQPVR